MTNPSTTVTPFSNLSVGADGTVYAVDKNQRVWRWNGTVWQEPTPGIRLIQVTVGNVQSVWGINTNQEIFQLVGATWTRPEPTNARAKQIAVGGDGTVWVVNAAGEMYQRQGNTWIQPEPKAARAVQVAVGNANNVWCVNAQNFVFQRAYVGNNYNWIQGDPTLARSKHVSVANDGSVWIVRPDGQLWQYWNSQWIHPEPRNVIGQQVEVGNSNTVWYLDTNGLPYRRVGNNQWQSIALPIPAPPPAPDFVYTVQPGDTLNAIATLFGVTSNAIMGANNLINPNMIVVNQKLKIPGLQPLPITADMPSYTVQYGDTLGAIASRYGVNLGLLLRLNNISDPRTLATGTILRLPKGSTVPPIYGGGTPIQYTVQAGDTLASIAARYGVTTQALLQANNLPNETWIRVGQILNIPTGGSTPTTPTTPTNYFTYIVQPGDALSLIAQRFGVPIEAIMRANNLVNPNFIVIGQVLYVPQVNVTPTGPVNPGNYRTYVVQAGDSLASIAARFAVTLETIMRANNLPSANALLVGQTLLIPATGTTPTGPITPGGTTTYVIQTGDTLATIATRFGVTTQAIMRVNNLPNEAWIRVGQILNIPPRGTGTGTTTVTTTTTTATNPLTGGGSGNKYVVQPGDSVAGIAQKFGITTQALMQTNGLTSPNFLIVGTVLTIPAGGVVPPTGETTAQTPASTTIPTSPMPPVTPSQPSTPSTSAGRSYTVQRGDTLQAIAAKFGVPMENIMKRNKLITPTAIKVGQVLVIP